MAPTTQRQKRRRIDWSQDEWRQVIIEAFKKCEAIGTLPLNPRQAGPYLSMIREAQHVLPAERHRAFTIIQPIERKRLIEGINEMATMAASGIKDHKPTVIPLPGRKIYPSDPRYGKDRERPIPLERGKMPAPEPEEPTAAEQVKAAVAPAVGALLSNFSFELIGKTIDQYVSSRVRAEVDSILPLVLGPAIAEAVDAIPKPDPAAIPGSADSRLLEDMVTLLDDMDKLRKYVEARLGPAKMVAQAQVAQAPSEMPPTITVESVIDKRPWIVVTGAHAHQMRDLETTYKNRLRLSVYTDVCPSKNLDAAEIVYVFESHSTKNMVGKLRDKVGRTKVNTIVGGLSAVKRNLDKHVAEQAKIASDELRNFLGT